jgi:hypothetical protein
VSHHVYLVTNLSYRFHKNYYALALRRTNFWELKMPGFGTMFWHQVLEYGFEGEIFAGLLRDVLRRLSTLYAILRCNGLGALTIKSIGWFKSSCLKIPVSAVRFRPWPPVKQ